MADLSAPPWVDVQGIDNFRDIGGYAVPDSPENSVRRNFCYRCADPTRITEEGRAKITSLGITTIFDLRSRGEIVKNTAALRASAANPTPQNDASPSPAPASSQSETSRPPAPFDGLPGVTHRFTPVFEHRDFSPAAMANYARGGTEGFTAAYRDILAYAPDATRAVLAHVRDRPGEPFALHCSAGKDRTGVLCAIMLKLAGVGDEVVAREYELTETGLAPMRELIIAYLRRQPGLDTDDAGLARMVSAKSENMLATLSMIREEHGGVEGYVRDRCGFTDDDIAVIRKNLVAETPPIL